MGKNVIVRFRQAGEKVWWRVETNDSFLAFGVIRDLFENTDFSFLEVEVTRKQSEKDDEKD